MHAYYRISNESAVQYVGLLRAHYTLMQLYVLESIAYTVQHVAYVGSEACTVYVWLICAQSPAQLSLIL